MADFFDALAARALGVASTFSPIPVPRFAEPGSGAGSIAQTMDRAASSTFVADPVRFEPTVGETANAPLVVTDQEGLHGSTTAREAEQQAIVSPITGQWNPPSERAPLDRASRTPSLGIDGGATRPSSTSAIGARAPADPRTSGTGAVDPGPAGDALPSFSRRRPTGDPAPSTIARERTGPPAPVRDPREHDRVRADQGASTPVARSDQTALPEPSSRARDAEHEPPAHLVTAVMGRVETEGSESPERARRIDSPISGPQVTITIGRVDVRAPTTRPSPVPSPPRRPQPRVSLDDYLRQGRRR